MKEIKDDINIWRDIPCPWVGRISIMKMTIIPNMIYRFNVIPIKLQIAFFTELEKTSSQFIWKHKRLWIAKAVLRKEWSWRNQPSWLQIILQSYSNQDGTYWHNNRNIDQWNKRESPEINPCTYEYFIFNKGGKDIQW